MAQVLFSGHGSWMNYYHNRWARFLVAKLSRAKPIKRKTTIVDINQSAIEDDEESEEEQSSSNATDS